RNHGVSRAGYVGNLITAENWEVDRRVLAVEGDHAVAAASDHERIQAQARHNFGSGGTKSTPILSNFYAERFFDFRLIRGGGGNTGELEHAMPGVEDDGDGGRREGRLGLMFLPAFRNSRNLGHPHAHELWSTAVANRVQDFGRSGAIAIVRDEQRIRNAQIFARGQGQLAAGVLVRPALGFAVDTHNLLTPGMRHSGENTSLGDGRELFVPENSCDRDPLMTETA